jgi:hypothetical protein
VAGIEPVSKSGGLWGDVLAGGGIGLLLGMLVGLSSVPVRFDTLDLKPLTKNQGKQNR